MGRCRAIQADAAAPELNSSRRTSVASQSSARRPSVSQNQRPSIVGQASFKKQGSFLKQGTSKALLRGNSKAALFAPSAPSTIDAPPGRQQARAATACLLSAAHT